MGCTSSRVKSPDDNDDEDNNDDNNDDNNEGNDNDGECDSDFVIFYEMEGDSDEVGQGYSKCHSSFEKY
jgi:hypothetical protein